MIYQMNPIAHNLLGALFVAKICYDHASENRSTLASPNFAVNGFTLFANKKRLNMMLALSKRINSVRKTKRRFLVRNI